MSFLKGKVRLLDVVFFFAFLALSYKVFTCECGQFNFPSEESKILTLRGVNIVDSSGRLRLTLGEGEYQTRWTTHTSPMATHGLFLYGYDGRPTAAFVSDTTIGGPEIQLAGFGPDQLATITSNSDGDVGLVFRNKDASASLEVFGNFQFQDSARFSLVSKKDEIFAIFPEDGPLMEFRKDSQIMWDTKHTQRAASADRRKTRTVNDE